MAIGIFIEALTEAFHSDFKAIKFSMAEVFLLECFLVCYAQRICTEWTLHHFNGHTMTFDIHIHT